MSATQKMMQGNKLFDELPLELQSKIINYNKRGRGRPASTKEMKIAAKDKKNIRLLSGYHRRVYKQACAQAAQQELGWAESIGECDNLDGLHWAMLRIQ